MTTQTAPKSTSPELPPLLTNAAGKVAGDVVVGWYRLLFGTRQMDERASRYIRRGMGWSYHARCAGHEGIQVGALRSNQRAQDDERARQRQTHTNHRFPQLLPISSPSPCSNPRCS